MKKWLMIAPALVLIGFGIYWFSIDRVTLTFKDGKWYLEGEAVEDFDVGVLEGVDVITFIADGDTKMGNFEAALGFCFASPGKDLVFRDASSGEEVKLDGLSGSQSERMNVLQMKLAKSMFALDDKAGFNEDEKFAIVGVAGDVLGVNFGNQKYVYTHLDGRGLDVFKQKLSGGNWAFRLTTLKETTLKQFMAGVRLYQESGAEISPLVSNEFIMGVFSESRVITMTNIDGTEHVTVSRELAEGEYEPKFEDFPKDMDIPEIEVVERELPMTIPSRQPSSMAMINPLLISVNEDGSVILNKKEKVELEGLKKRLQIYNEESKESGSSPIVQIYAHPDLKQQKVIDVLNIIRDADINEVTFTDSSLDKGVKPNVTYNAVESDTGLDPMEINVLPKVTYNTVDADEKRGRIVINVRDDGTFSQADFTKVMKTEAEIQTYVTTRRKQLIDKDPKIIPKIHLRGNDEALFKYSQIVLKGAAAAGVDKIVFSVFPFKEEK